MKKVIALSIGLAFSVASLAQEQVQSVKPNAQTTIEKAQDVAKNVLTYAKSKTVTPTQSTTDAVATPASTPEVKPEVKAEPVVESKPEVKPSIETPKTEVKAPIKEEVKITPKAEQKNEVKPNEPVPVSEKPVVKKKHVVKSKKKVDNKPIVKTEPNAVLIASEYYHIPKNLTEEEVEKVSSPIKSSDVSFNLIKVDDKLQFGLIDSRINKTLDQYYLKNGNVHALTVSTDLSEAKFAEISYQGENTYSAPSLKENNCQSVFVQFQLKNVEQPLSFVKYLDNSGNIVDSFPHDCKIDDLDAKDTVFTTNSGNIVNIGFNQKAASQQALGMTIHFTKDGKEYFPNDLRTYAIKQDFSSFVPLNSKNSSSPYLGVEVNQKTTPGAYYILVGFEHNKKHEWIKASSTVQ